MSRTIWLGAALTVLLTACTGDVATKADISALNSRIDKIETRLAAPTREEPVVVAKTQKDLRTSSTGDVILTFCVTYRLAGTSQEACGSNYIVLPGRMSSDAIDASNKRIKACWDESKVGEPLPNCWR